MDQSTFEKLEDIERKIDVMSASVEKLRKYFLWTLIITLATVVLPILVLVFLVPWVFNLLSTTYVNIQ